MSKVTKNRLEWTVFALSLMLVLGTLGFLALQVVESEAGPPDIVVRLGDPMPTQHGYLVPVQVTNSGRSTAEQVKIPVVLELANGEREEAELDLAFLPRDSQRNGYVSFREDPARGTLAAGAIAFEVP
jgi:uncharacterized protein (TIGR02588 family)